MKKYISFSIFVLLFLNSCIKTNGVNQMERKAESPKSGNISTQNDIGRKIEIDDLIYKKLSGLWEIVPHEIGKLNLNDVSHLSWGEVRHQVLFFCIIDLRASPPYIQRIGFPKYQFAEIREVDDNHYVFMLSENPQDSSKPVISMRVTFVEKDKLYFDDENLRNMYHYRWSGPDFIGND